MADDCHASFLVLGGRKVGRVERGERRAFNGQVRGEWTIVGKLKEIGEGIFGGGWYNFL